MKIKACKNCNQQKPFKSFSRGNKNCNTCRCILTRLRKKHRETLQKPSPYFFCEESWRDFKICSKCGIAKAFNEYYKSGARVTASCIACSNPNRNLNRIVRTLPERKKRKRETSRMFLINNPDKYQKYLQNRLQKLKLNLQDSSPKGEEFRARYYENRRKNRMIRRAREANAFIHPFTKADIIKRDGLNCYLCNKLLTESEATIDHVLPLSRGGHHKPENAKIACNPCNMSKNSKTLSEYKLHLKKRGRETNAN